MNKTKQMCFRVRQLFLTDLVSAISGQLSPLNVLQLIVLERALTTIVTIHNVSSAHALDSKYDPGENRTRDTSIIRWL